MNERIRELAEQANWYKPTGLPSDWDDEDYIVGPADMEKFAELIIRACVEKLETYRIPVGNSASGELACEWTYDALLEIRDEIREHFGMGVKE